MTQRAGFDGYTRRALMTRLLGEASAAEASHVVVAGLVGALLWGRLDSLALIVWLSSVIALAAVRVYVRGRVRHESETLTSTPRVLRFAIIAVALAWGLGAFLIVPAIPEFDLALLLVVFCGLSAAATVTLLGDPPAFYGYTAALLGPLALGVLRVDLTRSYIVAFVLICVYAAVLVMLYRRLHGVLLDSLTTAHRLLISQGEAETERQFLELIVGSAPMGIVVLDASQRVARVNPMFERTFGFTPGEAIGRDIESLVVPEAERGAAALFRTRVAAGGTVTEDGTRARKDGSLVYVRISAARLPGRGDATVVMYDDVTEAKVAELQVRESEERLFQTLEHLPLGIMVVDRQGSPTFANASAKALLGQGVGPGIVGDQLAEVYGAYVAGTSEPYPTDRMPIIRALSGERTTVDDMEIRRPDGAIQLEVVGSPVTDRAGVVVLGIAAFRDVTARKRRGRRVAARNAVVRVLAESLESPAVVANVLRAVCESFGWGAGAMWRVDRGAGVLRLDGFWSAVDGGPTELERVSRDMTFTAGQGIPGRIWQVDGALWIADLAQDAVPARARAAAANGLHAAIGLPLRVNGSVVGVIEFFGASMHTPEPELIEALQGIAVQMGEALARRAADLARREAEAQYRELVEASSDMVWRIDANSCLTFLNQAAEQIYGRPVRELIGRPYTELCDAEHRAADRKAMSTVFAGGGLTDYETVHRDAGGAARHLSTSARPIRDAAGAIVGVQGIARDVGERAAARDALRAARDAAEQAAAARSAFLANMSHEIRTPINGVLGMAELLLDSDLSDDDRRSVEMIVSSGEALLGVINDILDFSKIEAQQMDIERTEFDLPAVVEATARLLMPTANEKSVELVTDIPDTVPQYVIGDPTRLRQVLTNLVSNAVKFTASGEVVVQVTPVSGDGAPGRLRFGVRDTGMGISPEQREAIFEPFRQADATTTRRFGGTGLGLSISRRLVALMGGTLSVESVVGAGSTFWFELALPRAERPTAGAVPRANLTDVRVLVVDDNPTNRDVMRRTFERAGCQVDQASNGQEALDLLRAAAGHRVPYQLVVTDVFMPDMDGFGLVTAIRADPAVHEVRVLMLSSASGRGDTERVRQLDVSAFLLKPAGRVELLRAAGAALGFAAVPAGRTSARHITAAADGAGLRVLLAEDNVVNQTVAATMLRRRGHTVDVVPNGREAVRAVERSHYDMVLMDLQMPEMDGREATAEIRKYLAGRSLPIVALTANAMVGERERCLAAGMDGYLAKPFKPHELFAVVEMWAAHPAAGAPVAADAVDVAAFRTEMRAAGAEEAVEGVLAVFLNDAPAKMTALEQGAAAGDVVALARSAHAFKSSSGAIHADGLAALLRDIELDAKSGNLAGATARLAATRGAYDAVMHQLHSERGRQQDD